jgi:hypothetical protein
MTIGSIGKALATQAFESTKNTVIDAVMPPDQPKPGDPKPAPAPASGPVDLSAQITGQIQAMQRPLRDDQELMVKVRAGDDVLRVTEIFVPGPQLIVFAGTDAQGNITRVISAAESAQVICKILKVSAGATAVRVNVLTPRPQPKPSA